MSRSTPAARTTLSASAVTSGPMPSPPITAIRCGALAPWPVKLASGPASSTRASTGTARSPPVASSRPWQRTSCPARPFDRLQAEFDDLTTRGPHRGRRRRSSAARELGDLTENGDYHAAKDEQGHMEGRIRQLESHPRERRDHRGAASRGVVGPGTIVTIVYEGDSDDDAERYLVGHIEEQTGDLDVISPTAPLGAALIGAPHRRHGRATRRPTAQLRGAGPRGGSGLSARSALSTATPTSAPLDRRRPPSSSPPLPPGRDVELPGRARVRLRELPRPARRADRRAAARLDGHGRPQLLHLLRRRSASTTACSRSTTAATVAGIRSRRSVPARGLRRRRRRAWPTRSASSGSIAVGYSMGGADRPADLAAPPRPRRAGLVLCATAAHFNARRNERLSFLGLAGLAAPRPAHAGPGPARG